MQPNGNMPGAGRPVAGAPVSNVNAKPAPVPTPSPAPKPAGPAFGNGGSVVEGKGGKKTGWILAVVFLLIVAAGGVGFGVWAMMDGNSYKESLNEKINSLENEIQSKDDRIAELEKDEDNNSVGQQEQGNLDNNQRFTVLDIGDCVMDSAIVENNTEVGNNVLKCQAVTSNGEGIFVWSSSSNKLEFILKED